jgi:hypothetical protein
MASISATQCGARFAESSAADNDMHKITDAGFWDGAPKERIVQVLLVNSLSRLLEGRLHRSTVGRGYHRTVNTHIDGVNLSDINPNTYRLELDESRNKSRQYCKRQQMQHQQRRQ